jgi:parallel beta-helix repeat protein
MMVIPNFAKAAKVTVCASGCDFPSIQTAVNAAGEGDVIIVKAGDYFENIVVDESVSIMGVDGPASTTVTSADGGTVFAIITSDVTVSGFTIIGSSDFNTAGVLVGGAFPGDLSNLGVTDVTVSNCIIEDNLQGVYVWKAQNTTIVNNTVRNNLDDGSYVMGTGIIVWDGNRDANVLTSPSQGTSIVNNEVYGNDRWGIFVGSWPDTADCSVTADNSRTKINGNDLYRNGDYRLLGGGWNWMGMGFSFTSGSKKVSGNKILPTASGYDIVAYDCVTDLRSVGNPVRRAPEEDLSPTP